MLTKDEFLAALEHIEFVPERKPAGALGIDRAAVLAAAALCCRYGQALVPNDNPEIQKLGEAMVLLGLVVRLDRMRDKAA